MAHQRAWERVDDLEAGQRNLSAGVARLSAHIDKVREHRQGCSSEKYAAKLKEIERLTRTLQEYNSKFAKVKELADRYTQVSDPVVASDGFTYPRGHVEAYVDECAKAGAAPVSKHAPESVLSRDVYANTVLQKVARQLKEKVPTPDEPTKTEGRAKSQPKAGGATSGPKSKDGSGSRLHPCIRVYQSCNFGDQCTWAQYPYDACLSHLKGRCRYGNNCHEMHMANGQSATRPTPAYTAPAATTTTKPGPNAGALPWGPVKSAGAAAEPAKGTAVW